MAHLNWKKLWNYLSLSFFLHPKKPKIWTGVYRQGNALAVKPFSFVLLLLCMYLFVVTAGVFLFNRWHSQAMGLYRRRTHQGIVLFLCWLVLQYLCITSSSRKTFEKRLCTFFFCVHFSAISCFVLSFFKTYIIGQPIYGMYASEHHIGVIFLIIPIAGDKRSGGSSSPCHQL